MQLFKTNTKKKNQHIQVDDSDLLDLGRDYALSSHDHNSHEHDANSQSEFNETQTDKTEAENLDEAIKNTVQNAHIAIAEKDETVSRAKSLLANQSVDKQGGNIDTLPTAAELQKLRDVADQSNLDKSDEIMAVDKALVHVRGLGTLATKFTEYGAELSKNMASIEVLGNVAKTALTGKLKQEKELEKTRGLLRSTQESFNRATREAEATAIEVAALRRGEQQAKEALSAARDIIFDIKDSNEKTTQTLEEVVANNKSLKGSVVNLEEKCERYESRLEVLTEQRAGFKLELDAASKQVIELNAELRESKANCDDLIEKNKLISNEISEINCQYLRLKEHFTAVKADHVTAKDEIAKLKREAELSTRKFDDSEYRLKTEIVNLTSQLSLAKNALKDVTADARLLKRKDVKESNRIKELEDDLQTTRAQKENYAGEIQQANAHIQEINLKYETAMIDLKHEQDQTRELNNRLDTVTAELKKNEGAQLKYENALDQIEKLKTLIGQYRVSAVSAAIDDEVDAGPSLSKEEKKDDVPPAAVNEQKNTCREEILH